MKSDHGVEPATDHYACVVDLLGRAGSVVEAYQLVNTMPSELDKAGAWSSLLGACRIHQNVEIGEIAANQLLELEPSVASHYVLLSNIYSSSGLWDKAMDVRRRMKEMGVKKEPAVKYVVQGKFILAGHTVELLIVGWDTKRKTSTAHDFSTKPIAQGLLTNQNKLKSQTCLHQPKPGKC
ncbi:pentatricopeptide repeat-containing protein [Prunus yedoensis var. nudiflora]|uniref:Pentatricopeptide repeat-containing protein n=1 Tax=Prunus yedoensis var. nudiflora TaxID=2094558 RepID=A0A314Y4N9_PRUYE|nr:pentatricopeptide repeat-containing protein [Prunus yedoensis var. nudiflora]